MNRGFKFISTEQMNKDFGDTPKIINTKIRLPQRGTKWSAGYDVFAPYSFTLQPNEEIKIPTGISAYMQPDEVLIIVPRSGLGFKYYCRLANTIGVIDADYINSDNEGHIWCKIRNEGNKPMTINQGDGMCQAIFMPYLIADNDNLKEGNERNGGFGSTTK